MDQILCPNTLPDMLNYIIFTAYLHHYYIIFSEFGFATWDVINYGILHKAHDMVALVK